MEFSFSFSFVLSWEFVPFQRGWLTVERTGEYVAHEDQIPLSGSGDLMKDKLLGILIADFAIAIVDEAETEEHVFQHWTVTGFLEDDNPTTIYLTI